MNDASPVQLIAIVGGSGAGKGWLVQRLCRLLGEKACHLQLDEFYRDRSHLSLRRRAQVNYDLPSAIDWEAAEQVLRECRAGLPSRVPRYDFATHCRAVARSTWIPAPLVFVDGLWLLRPAAVRSLFDFSIYIDTPRPVRRTRRLARDVRDRGYTADAVEHQLRTAVEPMHDRYVEPQKKWADFVLTHPFTEEQLVALSDRLWEMLTRAALVPPWMHETFRAELLDLLCSQTHEYSH